MSQTPRSLIQLHHILTSSWEHIHAVIPQMKFFRYQNFVKFIISYNFILSQGGREGEVNDFILKRKLSFWQVKIISNHLKGSWDMATSFWLQGQAPTFPSRVSKKTVQVHKWSRSKTQQCGINFCFLQGWDLDSEVARNFPKEEGRVFWAPWFDKHTMSV